MMPMRYLLLSPLLFAITPLIYAADPLPAGKEAPDFTLPSQAGLKVRLDSYRGRWVVLYFYPRDNTTGCTIEAANFERKLPQFLKLNAQVLGISSDTVELHNQFCTRETIHFKLLADPTRSVISSYNSLASNGQVAARNTFLIGPKGVIRKVYTHVDPYTHAAQVLADLRRIEKAGAVQ
jgi:peroxiredoxin Q/BCP